MLFLFSKKIKILLMANTVLSKVLLRKKKQSPLQKRGFTLIEILVVVVIFLILASFLLGAIARARKKAFQTECINNLKNLGSALHMYSIDYRESFPTMGPASTGKACLALLHTLGYVRNEGLFICPQGDGTSAADGDYRYAPGLTENSSAESALACDDQANQHLPPRPVVVLYVKGSVQSETTMPSGPSAPIE